MADTIFAQATARGRAGIAVIRISGAEAFAAARGADRTAPAPRPRRAAPAAGSGERRAARPAAWCSAFPGPGASPARTSSSCRCTAARRSAGRCCAALAGMPGLRLAEPGEFTRRALLNGRLDLAQVEGLGDLIAAETAAQQRQALRVDGRGAVHGWLRAGGAELVAGAGIRRGDDRLRRRGAAGGPAAPRRGDRAGAGRRGDASASWRAAGSPSGSATASRWRWSGRRTSASRRC